MMRLELVERVDLAAGRQEALGNEGVEQVLCGVHLLISVDDQRREFFPTWALPDLVTAPLAQHTTT